MSQRVIALLDRPAADSLGMVGLVVADDNGSLKTQGVRGSQSGRLASDEIEDLIGSGHAHLIQELQIDQVSVPHAALWIGKQFADASAKAGLAVPPVPQQNSVRATEGDYWIAPVAHVWHVIDFWALHAFRRVVANPDKQIATLMTWAVPNKPETQAARWLTAKSSEAKDQELEWSVRLERDSGRRTTRESLRATFTHLIERASTAQNKRVVGFSALAAGGDKEIAQFVAKARKVPNASFGGWLRDQAAKQGERKPDRRYLQTLGQTVIDKRGELALFLEVLDFFHLHPAQPFIIEGIRHKKVLESIRTLVGSDLFFFAFVERPESERIQRLHEREHLSAEDVRLVLTDRTEREIPDLKPLANISLDLKRGVEVEGARVIKELASV